VVWECNSQQPSEILLLPLVILDQEPHIQTEIVLAGFGYVEVVALGTSMVVAVQDLHQVLEDIVVLVDHQILTDGMLALTVVLVELVQIV
jgi:hypothetical protein